MSVQRGERRAALTNRSRGRGAPDTLTPDRIAAAAVALLDREGLEALSMRRLAAALGAGAMSLYWHVANKEQVLDLALDSALAREGSLAVSLAPDSEPRAELLALLEDWRACLLRHPWAIPLLAQRPMGRSLLARLELLGAALDRLGVPEGELRAAVWSLWNLVLGAAVSRATFDARRSPPDAAGEASPAGLHPTLDRIRLLEDGDWDGTFRSGVAALLNGTVARP